MALLWHDGGNKRMVPEQLAALKTLAPHVDGATLSQLLSCCHALITEEAVSLGLPDFPLDNLSSAAIILENFPDFPLFHVFYRFYPYKLFLNQEGRNAVEDILKTFSVFDSKIAKDDSPKNFSFQNVNKTDGFSEITISYDGKESSTVKIPHGSGLLPTASESPYIETNYQNSLVAQMIQSQSNLDLCLIGPKGCGKSITVQRLAELLEYQVEPIILYQDMTSRDLIQYRTTLLNGDTIWKDSPLVTAALEGKLALLDGIHRIHPSTLAVIYRLVHDRELQLHDGKRLLRADRYDEIKSECNKTDEDMEKSGVYKIHPSFRIVALAEPPVLNSTTGQWLNSELLNLFLFHEMRPLEKSEEIHIIREKYGEPKDALLNIIELAHSLRSSNDPTMQSLASSLSTRQLLRIAARMHKFANDDAYDAVHRACLARFLPSIAKQALEDSLKKFNISPKKEGLDSDIRCIVDKDTVTIGATTVPRYKTSALTKVPDILFYDVPQHLILLETLVQDFILGQNLLLVGNQGVGKNKIVDRLLQILNRPREYIQLHRDTTVQTLTVQPMVRDGVVVYEDSPLVQAVKLGHVLVVDEADKAPTHVTCILKTLVESGEMILSDGRRIIPALQNDKYSQDAIPMHPDFRMIVLANRPGFPFLGNDFFGAIGDLFSTHSVDNPSVENEIQLLKQYGPNVDDKIVHKLVKAFGELRSMADQGLVSYPYSTREVVNIVKHLQKFPNEPLAIVVKNVFDFDRYSQEVFDTLIEVLHKHGIPIGTSSKNVALAKELPLPDLKLYSTWNIQGTCQTIPIQERFFKNKPVANPPQKTVTLDKIEARSAWFTELDSYWSIPMNDTSTVAALSVSPGLKADGSDDKINVLASNPLSLFIMSMDSDKLQELSLQGLISPLRGNRPLMSLANDKKGNILVHEETSNSLLSVDPVKGIAYNLQLSSMFDSASDKISQVLGNRSYTWKLRKDLIESHNQIVIFTPNNNKIEVMDLDKSSAFTMTLPFEIDSILLASPERWLIQSTQQDKFILQKSLSTSPCPNILRRVDQDDSGPYKIGSLLNCSKESLSNEMLGKVLNQKIESPNRIVATNNTYASIVVGFPELDSSNEVFSFPRNQRVHSFSIPIITQQGTIIRTIASSNVPSPALYEGKAHPGSSGYLEITDPIDKKLRYVPIPAPMKVSPVTQWLYDKELPLYVSVTSNQGLVTIDAGGCIRVWETSLVNLEKSLGAWKKMVGADGERLQITKERYSGLDVTAPKHGKVDPNNDPHVGGNTWAGGTGGRDTAGLGGKGGPYRLDAGHTVHQLSDEEKNAVPEHVKKAAREMGLKVFKQRLNDIRMSEYDHEMYSQFSNAVQREVQALRVILGSLQAKSNERQWCRHQTSGDLDDTKLIEGLTGEKTIYRRRAEKEPDIGAPQLKPKRLKLVVDVSGSMYRFNSYDGRLDREMEACVMVMEAFSGYENKFQYDIVGHSGDDYRISFVDHTQPPADNKRRLEVIKTMHAHSQFCMSGDHTLEATKHAICTLAKEDTDESIVVVLSDANLERYGIRPEVFAKALTSNADVDEENALWQGFRMYGFEKYSSNFETNICSFGAQYNALKLNIDGNTYTPRFDTCNM
ncbi:hypothetical protein TSAR_009759 [Trichomalopsis sarcophagae]|uniref:AAA+ ATPase domain-containing protein n=1 Tax=Trichomalopsis sarcophagae TaxID=543379 RepID=A0A232EKC1_9HYME|nr:hypothetical protein TSAR_009759 [Trichomalopsis sarcophagae]